MTRFIADSCSDMLQMEGVDFVAVPLTISTDVKDYVDNENLDVKGMTEDLAGYKGKSCTACPGVESWLNAFEGADVIYVGTMTSTLPELIIQRWWQRRCISSHIRKPGSMFLIH